MTTYDLSGNPATLTKDEAEITQFGCPWHGMAKNGALYDAPGGTEIKAVWPQSGPATQLLQVPGIAAVSRTPEEAASDAVNNFNWKNYALVAGSKLYGQDLPDSWVIYIDDNDVPWLLTLTCVPDSPYGNAKFDVTVKLVSLFGRFSLDPYPAINSTIATASLASMAYGGATHIASGDDSIERNSRGSEVFINIYAEMNSYDWDPGIIAVQIAAGQPTVFRRLNGVVKISISGNGSLNRATLGDGITATITRYKYDSELYTAEASLKNAPPSDTVTINGMTVLNDEYDPATTPDPPCPEYQSRTITYGPGGVTPVSHENRYRGEQEYTLRYLFDGDAEVVYSAVRWTAQEPLYIRSAVETGEIVRSVKQHYYQADGVCQLIGEYYDEVYSSAIYRVVDDMTYIYNAGVDLKRNGTIVDSMTCAGDSSGGISYWDVVDEHGNVSQAAPFTDRSGEWLVNRVVVPGENINVHVHAYSPQLFGLQATDDTNSWCMVGGVATPWGVDLSSKESTLSNNGLPCVGSHEPVDQVAHWYEPGVLDVAGAKINFV